LLLYRRRTVPPHPDGERQLVQNRYKRPISAHFHSSGLEFAYFGEEFGEPVGEPAEARACIDPLGVIVALLKSENFVNAVGLLHLNRMRAQAPCT
jgi:hypothetical protein